MDYECQKRIDAVFELLQEQREMLNKYWPYTPRQTEKDKLLWARMRELIDQLHPRPTKPNNTTEANLTSERWGPEKRAT